MLYWDARRRRHAQAAAAESPEPKGGRGVPEFPSKEWLDVYVERINSSPEYKEAAATWEGDISYVFEAEPDKGVPEDLWAWLDLWHGECRDSKYGLTPEEGEKAKFIIRA